MAPPIRYSSSTCLTAVSVFLAKFEINYNLYHGFLNLTRTELLGYFIIILSFLAENYVIKIL